MALPGFGNVPGGSRKGSHTGWAGVVPAHSLRSSKFGEDLCSKVGLQRNQQENHLGVLRFELLFQVQSFLCLDYPGFWVCKGRPSVSRSKGTSGVTGFIRGDLGHTLASLLGLAHAEARQGLSVSSHFCYGGLKYEPLSLNT